MARVLDKKARDVIVRIMKESGEMTVEDIMELIRPHYIFDPQAALDQAIRRKANQLAAQMRDEFGVRTMFNCKVDGVSKYVNLDVCTDYTSVSDVDRQLAEKLNGLMLSSAKASRRKSELAGQMKLDLEHMR